ncbi:hypothetical protein [Streptomyces sp. NPDC057052]|uniref:hypothetical protein n=1 Tax=Streptomyces sp. NPDC057052 TaxID=3346010 RepID=UPI0036420A0E
MRAGRSTTVAAVAGALALTAFAAPAAEAADTGITVSGVVVNGGRPIVVGTTKEVYPGLRFRVTWPAGHPLDDVDASLFLYHGTTAAQGADHGGIYCNSITCYEDGSRAADCEGEFHVDPRYRLDSDGDATTRKVASHAMVRASEDRVRSEEYLTGPGTAQVERAAKATADASPEPVAKGKKLTVTGRLTRADRVRHAYVGHGGKAAKLQFRKAGTSTCSTVRIVNADSAGHLRTTVTANADGYWRWTFGETATTGGASAAGDYVDARWPPPGPGVAEEPYRPGVTPTNLRKCRVRWAWS